MTPQSADLSSRFSPARYILSLLEQIAARPYRWLRVFCIILLGVVAVIGGMSGYIRVYTDVPEYQAVDVYLESFFSTLRLFLLECDATPPLSGYLQVARLAAALCVIMVVAEVVGNFIKINHIRRLLLEETADVFISYRRDNGSPIARAIRSELTRHDVHVFLDVDDLASNVFYERLLDEIGKASNFIVVLTPGALDRVSDKQDWVRREISHAILLGKNIIPVIVDDFEFPSADALPEGLAKLPRYNAVKYTHEHFESTINKILEFLVSARPHRPRR